MSHTSEARRRFLGATARGVTVRVPAESLGEARAVLQDMEAR